MGLLSKQDIEWAKQFVSASAGELEQLAEDVWQPVHDELRHLFAQAGIALRDIERRFEHLKVDPEQYPKTEEQLGPTTATPAEAPAKASTPTSSKSETALD